MKRFSNSAFIVFLVGICTFCTAEPAKPRIVGAEDSVQSTKRGICVNKFSAEDFQAVAPGVLWYYNWHYETKDIPPAGVKMEFLPMAWGDTPEHPLSSRASGMAQRLPGGDTLITEPAGGRALEVAPDGRIVWEFRSPHRTGDQGRYVATLFQMWRLPPDFPTDWVRGTP